MTAEIWADVLHVPCPTCHVAVNAYCVLKGTAKTFAKHAPCLQRLRAAEKAS